MFNPLTAAIAAVLLSASGAAGAASIIELRGQELDQPISNDIEINGQRARVTVRDGESTADIQFDAESNTAYVIDHEQKTYVELTEQAVVQIGTQVKNMLAQLQAQMDQAAAGMSEEQKAQLGGLLGQLGANGAGATPGAGSAEFTRNGASGEAAGIPCARGTLTVEGGESAQLCVARREDIDLPVADYATLRAMIDFAGRIAGHVSAIFPGAAASVPTFDMDTLDGLPVEISDANMHVAVTSVSQQPRPPIALPDGYTRRTNPLLGQ